MKNIIIRTATEDDASYAEEITREMEASAIARGSGIAKRPVDTIVDKMKTGKAVIALTKNGYWVGFSYIEIWAGGEFVSNSGLIVAPAYRGIGVAGSIKRQIFRLSRKKYPSAKIFSITTGLAVMKMNAALGFQPVTYQELPADQAFWQGCKSCVNFNILQGKSSANCLCTAMLYVPEKKQLLCSEPQNEKIPFQNGKVWALKGSRPADPDFNISLSW